MKRRRVQYYCVGLKREIRHHKPQIIRALRREKRKLLICQLAYSTLSDNDFLFVARPLIKKLSFHVSAIECAQAALKRGTRVPSCLRPESLRKNIKTDNRNFHRLSGRLIKILSFKNPVKL